MTLPKIVACRECYNLAKMEAEPNGATVNKPFEVIGDDSVAKPEQDLDLSDLDELIDSTAKFTEPDETDLVSGPIDWTK